jgi:TRAP-type uncharacterized transport system fused permease subunit
MKLLPLFIPFVKDAAKSVKRICLEEFKEVVDETLTELLGIATLVVRMYTIRREGDHEGWFSTFGVLIVRRLRCVHTVAPSQRHSIRKNSGASATWMFGAKGRFCISWHVASDANNVAALLPRNCPLWILTEGKARSSRNMSINRALPAHARRLQSARL